MSLRGSTSNSISSRRSSDEEKAKKVNLDLVLEPAADCNYYNMMMMNMNMNMKNSKMEFRSSSSGKVFSCNYCQRKFYSSQALGGHQNAHKLERTLAKKSRDHLNMMITSTNSSPIHYTHTSSASFGPSTSPSQSHHFSNYYHHTLPLAAAADASPTSTVQLQEEDHLDLSLRL